MFGWLFHRTPKADVIKPWADPILKNFHPGKLRQIVDFHFAATEVATRAYGQIEAIKTRASDDTLRLAVFGEFSSGKSSFINALMKKRLLKSASRATTAAGTYIRQGEIFSIKISLNDGKEIYSTEKKPKDLLKFLKKNGEDKCKNLNDVLACLSVNEDFAQKIHRIDVTIPFEFQIPNLEIIDTPGFNSGEEKGRRHYAVTAEIAQKYADCGIVIIPATQAGTADLFSFLKENLGNYLEECIFILTRADSIDEEEESLEEFLEEQQMLLQKKLSLKACPVVFPVSSISELREEPTPRDLVWQKRFSEMTAAVRERLIRSRTRILQDSLAEICRELRDELSGELSRKQSKLEEEKAFLQRNQVSRIEDVTLSMLNQVIDQLNLEIENFAKSVNQCCSRHVACAESEAKNAITAQVKNHFFTDREDIEALLKPILNKYRGVLLSEVKSALNTVSLSVQEIRTQFLQTFEAHYSDFPALQRDVRMKDLKEKKIQKDFDFESFQSISSESILEDVFEGIFELGATIWDRINGGSKSISRYCEMYLPQVRQYFDGLCGKIFEIFDEEQIPSILKSFEKLAVAHIKKYRSSVEELLLEHEKKREELDALLNQINQDIKFLEDVNFQTNK